MPYTHAFDSTSFPNSVVKTGTRKDVGEASTDVLNIIKQLQSYIDNGQIQSATEYYAAYKRVLEPFMDSAEYHNKLAENLHNTGLMALTTVYTVIDTIEPMQDEMCYWEMPY